MLRVAEKAELTHAGKLRRVNEDSYLAQSPLFVVADGMGGAQAGEVASATAVEVFRDGVPDGTDSIEARLAALVAEANSRVHEKSVSDRDLAGMGTTTTALYVGETEVSIAHVGDSRAYLLRDGVCERLTNDHTLVDELVRQGKLTPEEAEQHPQRSIITRALGPEGEVEVDTLSVRGRAGDVFLVCSDGLTSMIPEQQVGEILIASADSLSGAASALVNAANDAGGRDNITVVLFRLEEVGGDAGSSDEEHTMVGEAAPTTAEVRAAVEAAPPVERGRSDAPSPFRARTPRPPREQPVEKRRRFRGLRRSLVIAAIVLIPIGGGAYLASQAVYFVGVASDGSVAVFQGLPYDLPFGVHLYSSAYVTGLTAAQLPAATRKKLLDHKLRSHDDAFDLARKLELGQVEGTGG